MQSFAFLPANDRSIFSNNRIAGYILFSNENRPGVKGDNPELTLTEIGKKLGQMWWGGLTDEERAEWNQKAVEANEANGIPPAGPKGSGDEDSE